MGETTEPGGKIEAAVGQLRKMADDAPVIGDFDEEDWEQITERSYAELDGFIQRLELDAERSDYREFVYKLLVGAAVYNERHEHLQEIDDIADRVEFRVETMNFINRVLPAYRLDRDTAFEKPPSWIMWAQDEDELRALFWEQEQENE